MDEGGQVDLFIAHHGEVQDASFPEYGAEGVSRLFMNDQGWSVRLNEAYVTTKSVELVACDGAMRPVTLYWGPFGENIIEVADLIPKGIGGYSSPPANYCGVRVVYAPFNLDEVVSGGENVPPNLDMDGQTVLLNYVAEKDDQTVSGVFTTNNTYSTTIDTSTLDNNGPIEIGKDQRVPVDITISKTYDSFFQGIDFATATSADIEANVAATLELDSAVTLGTTLTP